MKAIMILLALFLIIAGGWFIGKAVIDVKKYKLEPGEGIFCIIFGISGIIVGVMTIWLPTVFF